MRRDIDDAALMAMQSPGAAARAEPEAPPFEEEDKTKVTARALRRRGARADRAAAAPHEA